MTSRKVILESVFGIAVIQVEKLNGRRRPKP